MQSIRGWRLRSGRHILPLRSARGHGGIVALRIAAIVPALRRRCARPFGTIIGVRRIIIRIGRIIRDIVIGVVEVPEGIVPEGIIVKGRSDKDGAMEMTVVPTAAVPRAATGPGTATVPDTATVPTATAMSTTRAIKTAAANRTARATKTAAANKTARAT